MTSPKQFNRSPRKYEPKGIRVLYEDHDIVVINKAAGLLTIGTDKIRDNTAYARLTSYVKRGDPKSRKELFIVHRLDRDTTGVIVFAKSIKAKRYLQDEWHHFTKQYRAVVTGRMADKEGVLSSHLTENSAHKVYSVNSSDEGKLAKTGYRVIAESESYSLLEITLFTGKKHQIRVQLADAGHPVAGDRVYARKDKSITRLALHAAKLTIRHPHTRQEMTFEAPPPPYFATLMQR